MLKELVALIQKYFTRPIPLFIQENIARISIKDLITGHDFIATGDYKLLYRGHATMYTGDGKPYKIDLFLFGLGKDGFEPYFDHLLELAYDPLQQVVNVVFSSKGDNSCEVRCNGNVIGVTERPDQAEIWLSDRPAKFLKKWASFYIEKPDLPQELACFFSLPFFR